MNEKDTQNKKQESTDHFDSLAGGGNFTRREKDRYFMDAMVLTIMDSIKAGHKPANPSVNVGLVHPMQETPDTANGWEVTGLSTKVLYHKQRAIVALLLPGVSVFHYLDDNARIARTVAILLDHIGMDNRINLDYWRNLYSHRSDMAMEDATNFHLLSHIQIVCKGDSQIDQFKFSGHMEIYRCDKHGKMEKTPGLREFTTPMGATITYQEPGLNLLYVPHGSSEGAHALFASESERNRYMAALERSDIEKKKGGQ